MRRVSGKTLGIIIAVGVVGLLAVYAATAGTHTNPSATALPATSPVDAAAAATPAAPAASPVPGLSTGSLLGLVIKVGIVALLLGISLWALKRYAGPAARSGGRTGAVSIVDTITLSQNRALYVLDVGDRAVVIGATPQQFSLIAEIGDETVLQRLRAGPGRGESPLSGVSRQITSLVQRTAAARAASVQGGQEPSARRSQQRATRQQGAAAPVAEVAATRSTALRASEPAAVPPAISSYPQPRAGSGAVTPLMRVRRSQPESRESADQPSFAHALAAVVQPAAETASPPMPPVQPHPLIDRPPAPRRATP